MHLQASFPIGVAVPAGDAGNSLLGSQQRQGIVEKHFNSLTAENIMKPSFLQPLEGQFDFEDADALLGYAQTHQMQVHGHTLLWHRQLPDWMSQFQGDWSAMMENHITQIVAHFSGAVVSWDVVNEVFDDAQPTGLRQSVWLDNLGASYIENAFTLANAVDPNARLYYNDYNLAGVEHKLTAVLDMAADFQQRNIPLHGIGFQMHVNLDWPAIEQIEQSFQRAVDTGLMVRISELDVAVNPNGDVSAFNQALAQRQAERYRQIVQTYLRTVPTQQRGGITLWGIADIDSWIPGFSGFNDWPLLFDDQFQGKPALQGFAEGLIVE